MTTLKLPPAGGTPREVASAISAIIDGKINAVGSFTLAAGAASTVVTDPRVGSTSLPLLIAQTANAAAEVGAGTLYIDPAEYVGKTSFKVRHANNGQTDRTFGYALLG